MKLYFPITVDLYNIYPLPTMNIQQHNIGRGALVTLTAAGQLIVPTAEQLYIYAKKKDGTLVYASCTLSGDQIKVDYDEQMAAVPGIMQMELQMVDGRGNSITTPIFQVNVQKTNIDYRGVTSSDEFTALIDALNKVGNIENINKQISDMEKNIGTISGLTTTEKGSLVGAINEIDRDVGNLQQLQTQTKTNMVDAVNELNGKMMSVTSVSVTVPNGAGGTGTLSIAEYAAGSKVVIPVITNAGSANWQQSAGIQGTLLVVSGPGVIQGHVTTVRLYLFS